MLLDDADYQGFSQHNESNQYCQAVHGGPSVYDYSTYMGTYSGEEFFRDQGIMNRAVSNSLADHYAIDLFQEGRFTSCCNHDRQRCSILDTREHMLE
ncbi:MAG: hypothetical protein MHPSP_004867 [Paramarteilia canceri]